MRRSRYPLHQSPFYCLRSRKKLCALLNTTLKELEHLLSQPDNYRVWSIPKPNGKLRQIEHPIGAVNVLHTRILNLLMRIETPDYLHSAVKGKSYISNADAHINEPALVKLDIRKFFPSTTAQHIETAFYNVFKCSRDVARLISRVCTFDGHLPTGSCISPLMAYFAHKPMFDSIHKDAVRRSAVMTCYVDDLTISGRGVNRLTLQQAKRAIRREGLEYHKERAYPDGAAKVVTGVVLADGKKKLPNRRHKAIQEDMRTLASQGDDAVNSASLGRLLGRINEAAQVDTTMKGRAPWLRRAAQDRHKREA